MGEIVMGKKTSTMLLMLLMCLFSCTQKLNIPEDPQVAEGEATILNAEVKPLAFEGYEERNWIWTSQTAVGMFGSEKGKNLRWVPRRQYHDSASVAVIYGSAVSGDIYGYVPFMEESHDSLAVGKAPLHPQQKYHAHPADHLMNNSVLVSEADGDSLVFDWTLGLLRLEVRLEIEGNVESVTVASLNQILSDAGNSIEIVDIDKPCTKKNPLELWVAVPEGTYTNFTVSVWNGVKNTVRPVEGTFEVIAKTIIDCPVTDKEYDYGLGDFEIENGEYE